MNTDRYQALLVDQSGRRFHPLNLTLGEAAAFEQTSGVIFENSAATKIEPGTNPALYTAQGQLGQNL